MRWHLHRAQHGAGDGTVSLTDPALLVPVLSLAGRWTVRPSASRYAFQEEVAGVRSRPITESELPYSHILDLVIFFLFHFLVTVIATMY